MSGPTITLLTRHIVYAANASSSATALTIPLSERSSIPASTRAGTITVMSNIGP